MKKIIAALLLCAVSLIAGCGSKAEPSSEIESLIFLRGKWDGDVFTSEFFGFTITNDPACEREPDEVLAYRNGLADMSDETFNAAVNNSDGTKAYIELAMSYHERGAIILMYSKAEETLDEVIRDTVKQLQSATEFKDVSSEIVTISGQKHPCIYATLDRGGNVLKEALVIYKRGGFIATVTLNAADDAVLQDMLLTVLG